MKLLAVSLASVALVSALAAPKQVSYDGWKVYRVSVGEDKAKLKNAVSNLQLGIWKGSVDTSKIVDVAVPPTLVKEFAAQNLSAEVMHENLGVSIAEESTFSVYAGKYPRRSFSPVFNLDPDPLHSGRSPISLLFHRIPPTCRPYSVPQGPAGCISLQL
jgi:hypothetical protein